jgi:hypothetical protein
MLTETLLRILLHICDWSMFSGTDLSLTRINLLQAAYGMILQIKGGFL